MSNSLIKLAKKFMKFGKTTEAAECFIQAGDLKSALDAFVMSKNYSKAAEVALSMGKGELAASLYLKAGRLDILCEFYEKRKEYEKAAYYYRRIKNYMKAAEMGENILHEFLARSDDTQNLLNMTEEQQRLVRLTASNHSHAQNFSRAAELFHKIGFYDKEAENHLKNRKYFDAGEAFKRFKMFSDAGFAYSKGEFNIEAAECFEKNKDFRLAADHYYKAKKYKDAGRLYRTTGDLMKATQVYTEGGEYDLALKVLAKVKPESNLYDDAIRKVIELSRKKGYVSPIAHRMFAQYLERDIDREHLKTYFEMAVMLEDSEFTEEATILYDRVKELDPGYFLNLEDKKAAIVPQQLRKKEIDEILEEDFHVKQSQQKSLDRKKQFSQKQQQPTVAPNAKTISASKQPQGLGLEILQQTHIDEGHLFAERYLISSKLGSGGMGTVYKAKDNELDELVAIKILSLSWSDDENLVARFKREIKLARQISHANIIRIFDLGNWKNYKYITMEYFEGKNLSQIISEKGRFSIADGLNICIQLCDGLNAAHSKGIIHRDIKSPNIMISQDNKVKLLDFGIAKAANITQLTMDGSILGTPFYISPECIMQKEIDHRSDIYSLGVVIYEIFTGLCPYRGEYIWDIMQKHLQGDPEPPSSLEESIPEELDDIILRCMELQPEDRFLSVAELRSELKMLQLLQ